MTLTDYSIVGTLLAIVGFLVIQWMRKTETDIAANKSDIKINKKELSERADSGISEAIEKFSSVANSLEHAIEAMNKNITSMEKVIGIFKAQVEIRDKNFEQRLSDGSKEFEYQNNKITDHEKRLTIIETNCKSRHEKTR